MGVNIKIQPYLKNKSNAFNRTNILRFTYVEQFAKDPRYYTITPYSESEIQQIIIQYGLLGRWLYGFNNEGEPTRVIIGDENGTVYVEDLSYIWLVHQSDWSNQLPRFNQNDSWVETHVHYKDDYRYYRYGDILNCEDKLLDQEIKINFRLESNTVMNLESSYGEFILHADTDVKNFFNTYWDSVSPDDEMEILFGIELFRDNISDAWMCSQRADITYDKLEDNYKIKCYDWVRIQLEQIGGEWSPYINYPFADVPITYYLDAVFDKFKLEGVKTIAELGDMSSTFSREEYKTRTYLLPGLENIQYISPEMNMRVNDFITEIQKHYAAFIYYDKDRVLRITRRGGYASDLIVIDDLIREETFEQIIKLKDYLVIAVNFEESDGSYKGWYLIEADPTSPNGMKISPKVSEEEIQDRDGVLDMRQRLPFPTFETGVFEYRGITNKYWDYEELLNELKIFKCTVNSLDIDLFTRIQYDGNEYRVMSVTKNYLNEDSEIEFIKII